MTVHDLVSVIPPWLVLSVTTGIALGAALRCLLPRWTPGLVACCAGCVGALAIGHLMAIVGELPSLRLGELRLLPGLPLSFLLLWLVKPKQV